VTRDVYTFADTASAADRLRLLADVYESASTHLLTRHVPPGPALALDLGCGPGHTTALLHRVVRARRTVGVDRSPAFLALAREHHGPGVEFLLQDVVEPLPGPAEVILARFLLTHLSDPVAAVRLWARSLAPGGRLVLQETARLVSADPVLGRYYELVAEVQRAQGQDLEVGARFAAIAAEVGLTAQHLGVRALRPDPRKMAALHVLNLRNWRTLPDLGLDQDELDAVDAALVDIAHGRVAIEPVDQDLAEAVLVVA
jgi:SAM-dependent methyltransferase